MLAAAKFRCWESLPGLILRILGKGFGEVQVRGFATGGTGISGGKSGIVPNLLLAGTTKLCLILHRSRSSLACDVERRDLPHLIRLRRGKPGL